jgi:hypothetical protein
MGKTTVVSDFLVGDPDFSSGRVNEAQQGVLWIPFVNDDGSLTEELCG